MNGDKELGWWSWISSGWWRSQCDDGQNLKTDDQNLTADGQNFIVDGDEDPLEGGLWSMTPSGL